MEFEVDELEELLGGSLQLNPELVVEFVQFGKDLVSQVLIEVDDGGADVVFNADFLRFVLHDIVSFGNKQLLGQLLALVENDFDVVLGDFRTFLENGQLGLLQSGLVVLQIRFCEVADVSVFLQVDEEEFFQGVFQGGGLETEIEEVFGTLAEFLDGLCFSGGYEESELVVLSILDVLVFVFGELSLD